MHQCYAAENRHYPVEEAGIWVDCIRERRAVFHNDYASTPRRKGYPKGHVPLFRHMSVPLFDEDQIIAVVGVGNKMDPYTEADANRLTMFLNAMWNVVSRKRAEQDLRATMEDLRVKERLEAILDNSTIATALLNDKHQILYANQSFHQLFCGMVPNQSLLTFVHRQDQATLLSALDQAQFPIMIEVRISNCQLEETDVEITLSPFSDSTYPDSMICNVRDISAHHRAEKQAFELRLHQERLRLLTEFVQNAAHEYRTPLAVIQTSLYLLKRIHPEMSASERKYMQRIEEQSDVINALTSSLLKVLRLNNIEKLDLHAEPINHIVTGRYPSWSQMAQKAGLDLSIELDALDPVTHLDVDEFTVVLDSLVHNACRYTPAGGQVAITTGSDQQQAYIRVSDTGIGISQEHLPHLFELFYRVDSAHTERGFGMGLPIAERIVQLHHGSIRIESEPGLGSVFEVALPLVSCASPASIVADEFIV
jgi:PAS domain S-box-containing protein